MNKKRIALLLICLITLTGCTKDKGQADTYSGDDGTNTEHHHADSNHN